MVTPRRFSRSTIFGAIALCVAALVMGAVLALLRQLEIAEQQGQGNVELVRAEGRIAAELQASMSSIQEIERFYRASQWVTAQEFGVMAFVGTAATQQARTGNAMIAAGFLDNTPPAGEAYVQFGFGPVTPLRAGSLTPEFLSGTKGETVLPGVPLTDRPAALVEDHLITIVVPALRTGAGQLIVEGARAFGVVDLSRIVSAATTEAQSPRLLSVAFDHNTLAQPVLYTLSDGADVATLQESVVQLGNFRIAMTWRPLSPPNLQDVILNNIWVLAAALLFSTLLVVQATLVGRSIDLSKAASQKSQQADRAKSRFLANMSHELRTPLNGILGMSDLVSRGDLTQSQRSQLATLNRSAESLLAIINGLLDFSKAEAGKMEVNLGEFNLGDLVADILKAAQIIATDNNTRLFVDYPWDVPRAVYSDELRIRQIIINLLNNAIKFAPGGCVTLALRCLPGDSETSQAMLEITVTDTGIGIAPDKIETLFQPFVQADASTERTFGGTGLGLSIVAQLCELLGGSVRCTSEEGQGTVFKASVALTPVKAVHPARKAVATFGAMNVLFVAQDPSCAILERSAASLGALVRTAATCGDAADILHRAAEPFDLVIIDASVEDDDAPARLRAAQPGTAFRLVRLLSSLHANAPRDPAPDSGIDGVLIEPLMPEHLAQRARSLFTPSTGAGPARQPKEKLTPTARDIHALIVEDDQINRLYAQTILQDLGCRVTLLENGELAVEALLDGASFDIVFMDCQMPVMDGLSATRHIRKAMDAERIRSIPIIALTANAVAGDREACLQAGMDDYLSKPVREPDFVKVLDTWCAPRPHPAGAQPRRVTPTKAPPTHPAAVPRPTAAAAQNPASGPAEPPFLLEHPVLPASPPPVASKTADPDDATPLLDEDALGLTKRTMGEGFAALIDIFEEDGQSYLQSLEGAVEKAEFKECVRLAHTLKSSGRMLGGARFTAVAANLEVYAKEDPETAEIAALVGQLKGLHGQTLASLRSLA